MTLSDQIKLSIAQFPTLYHSRAAVYDHLFFVTGNGYDWSDALGTLTSGPEQSNLAALADIERYVGAGLHKTPNLPENSKYCRTIPADIEERCQRLDHQHWYEISNYSRINKIPNNIPADWLNGIWEAINLYANSTYEQSGMYGFDHDPSIGARTRYIVGVTRAKELVIKIREQFKDHVFEPVVIEPFDPNRKGPIAAMKPWPIDPFELVPTDAILNSFIETLQFCYRMEPKANFKSVGGMEGYIDRRKKPINEILRLLVVAGMQIGYIDVAKDESDRIHTKSYDDLQSEDLNSLILALPDDAVEMKTRLSLLRERSVLRDEAPLGIPIQIQDGEWTGTRDYMFFERVVRCAVENMKAAYRMRRINEKKDVPYTGYDIPSSMKAGCISPDERLTADGLKYDKEDQGRSALEVILGLVIGVASGLGARMGLRQIYDFVGTLPPSLTNEELTYLAEFTPKDGCDIVAVALQKECGERRFDLTERLKRRAARMTPEEKTKMAEMFAKITADA